MIFSTASLTESLNIIIQVFEETYLTHMTIMAHAAKVQTIRTEYLKPVTTKITLIC